MEMNFEERYQQGDTPWDHGAPDVNLVEWVNQRPIQPCRVLDIGCGTGENAIWLARHGFDVLGCDLSETAINRAREKALKRKVSCAFQVADYLNDSIEEAPFGFIFDRGCFHGLDDREKRILFVQHVAADLTDGGWWLSLVGSCDEPERDIGPPQLSATELIEVVEPYSPSREIMESIKGGNKRLTFFC